MKNTFTTSSRKLRLVLVLLSHRQARKDDYSEKEWHRAKMDRYRTRRRLLAEGLKLDSFDYDSLVSRCLYVNWNKKPGVFVRDVKGCDLNAEVTRLMKQLLKGTTNGRNL